jgi:hypothetical protein
MRSRWCGRIGGGDGAKFLNAVDRAAKAVNGKGDSAAAVEKPAKAVEATEDSRTPMQRLDGPVQVN